jgi:hypothetical protein
MERTTILETSNDWTLRLNRKGGVEVEALTTINRHEYGTKKCQCYRFRSWLLSWISCFFSTQSGGSQSWIRKGLVRFFSRKRTGFIQIYGFRQTSGFFLFPGPLSFKDMVTEHSCLKNLAPSFGRARQARTLGSKHFPTTDRYHVLPFICHLFDSFSSEGTFGLTKDLRGTLTSTRAFTQVIDI